VAEGVTPPPGVSLLTLTSWLGWGPPPDVVELADWAAWRWAGPAPFFLRVASPVPVVRALPLAPPRPAAASGPDTLPSSLLARAANEADARDGQPTILRLPPTTDLLDLVLAAVHQATASGRSGSALVLVPSVGWAERLAERLNRRGYPATTDWVRSRAGWPIVIGSRAAAWAPVPDLAAALVLDAHDPAYREQSAPTYSAVDVMVERARRAGCPCVLASPVPPATVTLGRAQLAPPLMAERAGWPAVERVDRRGADPRLGLFSEEFVRLARSVLEDPGGLARRGPLVCVYDRTGRARLLACARCGELACCSECGAAAAQEGERLRCPRCGAVRPCVCAACGRLKMKTLRAGVSRLREELAALLGVEVTEVSGPAPAPAPAPADADGDSSLSGAPVALGTQAVLHRTRRASAVAFLDFDLHLLAPRLDATDESLGLLVRAARLVGARGSGTPTARTLLQTRVPDHPVVAAALGGQPAPALEEDLAIRQSSGLPPFRALALVSGVLAPEFAAVLRTGIEANALPVTLAEMAPQSYLLRAAEHRPLCDLLATAPRPPGRGLRVEIDPSTV
jgi:primosomal protein N' (replication factor Y) (superfamily II helicase)